MFEPHPFAICGEALVEPDVLPPRRADGVPKPLMSQLVRQQQLFGAAELRLGADKAQVVRIERIDGVVSTARRN